jgi:putative heme iron utilization protein
MTMTPELAADLRTLLAASRVLSLGVLVENAVHVGFLPYALDEDGTSLLVHASKLARHTRGLLPGAEFSALIHQSDAGQGDPAQLRRVTLHGRVVPLARDTPQYLEARRRYLARLPWSAPTFQLGDFGLFALRVETGRYVGGFAQAVDVRAEDLRVG